MGGEFSESTTVIGGGLKLCEPSRVVGEFFFRDGCLCGWVIFIHGVVYFIRLLV